MLLGGLDPGRVVGGQAEVHGSAMPRHSDRAIGAPRRVGDEPV